ncbi:MAG: beta-glucosidase [Pseudarthrobacter sp.]|nr:beta-glucosidase [Pseudarthrobacter sp.]
MQTPHIEIQSAYAASDLDLASKIRLLTAASMWRLHDDEKLGLLPIVASDGPSGVRGELWDERHPSLSLPSGSSLGSTWDEDAAQQYGRILASQAKERGVHIVLGPTINLQRSPLAGRHFEALSEDPFLTARMGVGYVQGVQQDGVAACPKHFVGNDSESERFTMCSEIDARTLREVYLAPFEAAVREARAWTIMSAYSGVNGVTMTENALLERPLKDEWGFDGLVISDWGAVRNVHSAAGGQDVVFPGPRSPWSEGLLDAVRAGDVNEADIDEKILRILLLAGRVGALAPAGALDGGTTAVHPAPADPAANATANHAHALRGLAAGGMVLLRNEGSLLPLDRHSTRSIAVIGSSARSLRIQGGGSATVLPTGVVSPLEALRNALPEHELRFALGSPVTDGITAFLEAEVTDPETGQPGVRVRFLDADGGVAYSERRETCQLVWLGTAPTRECPMVEIDTVFTPNTSGPVELGFAMEGDARLWIDGELFHEAAMPEDPDGLAAGLLNPRSSAAPVTLTAGIPLALRLRYTFPRGGEFFEGSLSVTLGSRPAAGSREALIGEAVTAAAASDVAVVMVGTSEQSESEGRDRRDLRLPGWQDELVAAVTAVNPRTVVVVNSGAPVELPWHDSVPAILAAWFPGQEGGNALADVLLGDKEPGGRLSVTWPKALGDVPVRNVAPAAGVLHYEEGLHLGYRAWLRAGTAPEHPFGHGLGYTTWDLSGFVVEPGDDGSCRASVTLTNTGTRPGSTVVQVYLSRPDSNIDRPVRWLAGFAKTTLDGGRSASVSVDIPTRAFAHWDDGWHREAGQFTAAVGFSAEDLLLSATVGG